MPRPFQRGGDLRQDLQNGKLEIDRLKIDRLVQLGAKYPTAATASRLGFLLQRLGYSSTASCSKSSPTSWACRWRSWKRTTKTFESYFLEPFPVSRKLISMAMLSWPAPLVMLRYSMGSSLKPRRVRPAGASGTRNRG